jgi:hypothetical protein
MNAEVTYLLSAIGALASVVLVLWRQDVKLRHMQVRKYDFEIKELKESLTDAIGRIRHLEQARLDEAVQHGHELKALVERMICEQAKGHAIMRGLEAAFKNILTAMAEKQCMRDFRPQPLEAKDETDTITRNHHGVK